jgi:hypothetical protein
MTTTMTATMTTTTATTMTTTMTTTTGRRRSGHTVRNRDRVLVMATLEVTWPRNDAREGVRHG